MGEQSFGGTDQRTKQTHQIHAAEDDDDDDDDVHVHVQLFMFISPVLKSSKLEFEKYQNPSELHF